VICPARVCSGLERLQLAPNPAKQLPHHAGASSFSAGGTVGVMEKAASK